jgi:hypothetical protein
MYWYVIWLFQVCKTSEVTEAQWWQTLEKSEKATLRKYVSYFPDLFRQQNRRSRERRKVAKEMHTAGITFHSREPVNQQQKHSYVN